MSSQISQIISSEVDDNLEEITRSAPTYASGLANEGLTRTTQETAHIKRRSIRGVLSYMGRSFATFGVTALATLALSAFLSAKEFGVYYVVTAVLGLFTFLSDVGLASALIQKKGEPTVRELRTTFTIQQLLAVLIFILILALTPYWQKVHHLQGNELWLLYVVAITPLIVTLKTIPSVLLTRQLRFDLLSIPAIAENMVFYAVVTFFAWQGAGMRSFIWGILARDLVGIILMYRIQRWPFGIGIWKDSLEGLLKYGFRFQINDLLARIKDDLFNVVIVAAWLDKDALGYIGWARRYVNLPQQFTVNNVTAITFPTFSRIQHDSALLRKAIEKTLYFITLIAFPMLAGLSVFMYPLVLLVPEYHKWLPALPVLALFAINIAWGTVSTPLTNTLNAIGQVNKTLWLMVMWTVLTWTITPVMIRLLGYTGVAAASAIIGFSSVATIIMVQRVIPFHFWANIWRQLLATAALLLVGLLGMPFWQLSFLWLIAGIFLSSLAFAIVFLVIGWKSLQKELNSLGLWPLFRRR